MATTNDMAELNKQNQIVFTKNQAVGNLLGAIITGLVAGFFGAVRTINSDHFALIALTSDHVDFKEQVGEDLGFIRSDIRDIRNALGINVQRPNSTSTTTSTTTTDSSGSTTTTSTTDSSVDVSPLPEMRAEWWET